MFVKSMHTQNQYDYSGGGLGRFALYIGLAYNEKQPPRT